MIRGECAWEYLGVAEVCHGERSPDIGDVVFAFVNLSKTSQQTDTFNVNISQNGSNLFGIDPNRTYNVRIAADTQYDAARQIVAVGGGGRTGSDVLNNAVLSLNAVPTSVSGWRSRRLMRRST